MPEEESMKASTCLSAAALVFAVSSVAHPQSADDPMTWAYPVNPPGFALTPDDGRTLEAPDSAVAYKIQQVRNPFFAPDWRPEDHPTLPDVVATGRPPNVLACGYCHRSTGPGGPENASLTGLPAPYILQQIADFKSGARNGTIPKRSPLTLMIKGAKGATDTEIAAAAAYFSGLTPKKLYTVVETNTAPKTHVYNWAYLKDASNATEPLGDRIVEVPADSDRFEARDNRADFMVYAPVGSVAKGKAIVETGGGKTTSCAVCHGPTLTGLGPYIPPIAGRSPTVMFRQLYDFQHGARSGPWSALMAGVVANLSQDDMLNVVAYLATLTP
ncbi:MAG: c-type cytochrome [Roseiarcus sp.]